MFKLNARSFNLLHIHRLTKTLGENALLGYKSDVFLET